MSDRSPNVLRVNSTEETAGYLSAVCEILLDIQRERRQTLIQIADAIDVSLGTISNAANKKGVLNPLYLARLGKVYGPHVLGPYAALFGGRIEPLEAGDVADILPFINRAALKISEARDPAGPGGTREIHTERFGYLSDLHALQREVSALIVTIEQEKAA